MPCSLKDIALEANVSINTVSRALRGMPGVKHETRRRVQSIARRLGYRPNTAARLLVLKRSHSIGVLVPDLNVPFFAETTIAIQDCLQSSHYYAYIVNTHNDPDRLHEGMELLMEHRIEGLISITRITDKAAEMVDRHGLPHVSLIMSGGAMPPHFVGYDDYAGGRLAARHLVELGHRRIAYYTGHWERDLKPPRYAGFVDEIAASGVDLEVSRYPDTEQNTIRSGYEDSARLVRDILKGGVRAVMCNCDAVALGLMHRLNETGLRIPEDVSVIGYDDIEMAEFCIPPLTTVAQKAGRLGELGSKLMLQLLGEKLWQDARHQILLEPELKVRRSTAAPRKTPK
ncbi:MAG TPA: LacI family DNA-binding transcriptional regulator [Candidatus Sumerlaeota bacterium]|nr:MAG: HTH-type transcriptional regulator DegA [candidate division BRC1 bacterium ADurb.BinA292]HOE95410.1 LacI family DNA-binding transcriptional regulator [Candidatus Sumerlaeota bacterium]HOR29380.1 LacI family DNA-binding transcriptional regulator [Candidatus Sumerlaeota bacterium]HPK02111.1 LacI family DNA-binding transcriptional regulator [Candidatus Sumerlaeota bacterium]